MEKLDYSLLDVPQVLRLLFYPRPDWRPPPSGARDVTFPIQDGVLLAGRFYSHGRSSASILFFHGNGEVASDYDDIAPLYNHIGLNLFVADYRGYGNSQGSPTISALVADSHATLDAFESLLMEERCTGPLYVMGRSLGAYCAVELAASYPGRIKGLITESGSANISGMMRYFGLDEGPELKELGRRHWARVRSIKVPLLVIHGDMDTLVPITRAQELYGAVASPQKRFETIPGAGHNDIMLVDTARYFQAIRDFVYPLG